MKALFQWFVALLIAGAFAGCSVNQKIVFNPDYSGSASSTINLSSVQVLLPKFDSTRTFYQVRDSVENHVQKVADSLKSIEGVSNIKVSWQDTASVLHLYYRFNTLETLNRAFLITNPGKCPSGKGCFAKRWNKLQFSAPSFVNDSSLAHESKVHFPYSLKLVFPEKVRKTNGNVRITDEHAVMYQGNLFDAFGMSAPLSFEVKTR